MKIVGLLVTKYKNKKYIVFHKVNKRRYFFGVYRTEDKAKEICRKYGKDFDYISTEGLK